MTTHGKKVLIYGNEPAGLMTAIRLAEKGVCVVIVAPRALERSFSQSYNFGLASSRNNDSQDNPRSHAMQMLEEGEGLGAPSLVGKLCQAAPELAEYAEMIGVVFNRTEEGNWDFTSTFNDPTPRTLYGGFQTGHQLVRSLVGLVRYFKEKGIIEIWEGWDFLSLHSFGGEQGFIAVEQNTLKLQAFKADALVFATEGAEGLWAPLPSQAGGTLGALLDCGLPLCQLEFMQFHLMAQTFSNIPYGVDPLLDLAEEEALRVSPYLLQLRPQANLKPYEPLLNKIKKLSLVDLTQNPLPLTLSPFLSLGGLGCDMGRQTRLEGVFVASPCSYWMHGAKALLNGVFTEQLFSGALTSQSVTTYLDSLKTPSKKEPAAWEASLKSQHQLQRRILDQGGRENIFFLWDEFSFLMASALGPLRSEADMSLALSKLGEMDGRMGLVSLSNGGLWNSQSLIFFRRFKNLLSLAKATLTSALHRKESRGTHCRSDFPSPDDSHFGKISKVEKAGHDYKIFYEDVPGRPMGS